MVGSEEGGKGGGGVTVGADRPCFLEAFQSSSQQVARSTGRTALYTLLQIILPRQDSRAKRRSRLGSSVLRTIPLVCNQKCGVAPP